MNVVAIMGRLTYEPELKTTPNGIAVIRFQVAVDRGRTKDGERHADFVDCAAWRQTAEFVSKYFHKGSMIAVDGSIQTNTYTDKNGQSRKTTEVVANNVSFCGSKNDGNSSATPKKAETPAAAAYSSQNDVDFEEINDDDDLPF